MSSDRMALYIVIAFALLIANLVVGILNLAGS
jgi:hypothetical protein